jgi:hypothetical protein
MTLRNRKAPNTESATVTARVISRLMKKAGFLMADTSDNHGWTEGFYVHRVGLSNKVSIGYHQPSHRWLDPEHQERRRDAYARLDAWLTERGYVRDQGSRFISCTYPD